MLYYYDDPLAAAWMQKHFGVNYSCSPSGYNIIAFVDCHYVWGNIEAKEQDYTYFVCPENYNIFEPKPGDKCTRDAGVVGVIGKTHDNGEIGIFWAGVAYHDVDMSDIKIIQRDGKPFHWPKHEIV